MSRRLFATDDIDVSSLPIEHGVLVGNDGELFLMGGLHWILKFAVGEASLAQETIDTFFANIALRRRVAAKFSARYFHMIAPEKYMVVPHSMPFEPRDHMASALLRHGLADDILYPSSMLAALPQGEAYYRTDSHWGVRGKIAIAELIAQKSGLPQTVIDAGTDVLMSAITGPYAPAFSGDLGRKFTPPIHESTPIFRRPFMVTFSENGLEHVAGTIYNDGRLIVAASDQASAANSTLLIFGDSYLHLSLEYLAAYFKLVVFCRSRFIHDEMVSLVKPDVIITQNAERYLNSVENDRNAPPFLLVPYLLDRKPEFKLSATKAICDVLRSNKNA